MATNALRLEDVHTYYGESHVLQGVSFCLGDGHLLGLLGRNGAGKTTCMSTIVGLLAPRRGRVEVFGTAIHGLAPEDIAATGIALVPQGRRIFASLTVRENLIVAARKPGKTRAAPWTEARVFETFPRLAERRQQNAGVLSGGEQQMLAIGRALMSNPRVLLMDEPSEGLAPRVIADVMDIILTLKAEGLSIILVEQNAKLVSGVADDIVILNHGVVAVSATPAEIKARNIDLHQHLGVF